VLLALSVAAAGALCLRNEYAGNLYTLMLVEQNATRALAIADRGYVLELGRNRFHGRGRELLEDPEVKRLYLGG